MLTAVQLRDGEALSCSIVHGDPAATRRGSLGPIALFGPGRLVAYLFEAAPRNARIFVFRTLPAPEPASPRVPGVFPGVDLLIATRSRGRVALLRNLFIYLARLQCDPAALSDDFYLRVAGVLAGKITRNNRVLRELLQRESL